MYQSYHWNKITQKEEAEGDRGGGKQQQYKQQNDCMANKSYCTLSKKVIVNIWPLRGTRRLEQHNRQWVVTKIKASLRRRRQTVSQSTSVSFTKWFTVPHPPSPSIPSPISFSENVSVMTFLSVISVFIYHNSVPLSLRFYFGPMWTECWPDIIGAYKCIFLCVSVCVLQRW